MTELGFAAAVLVASLALTYLFCLRPMHRGRCAMSPRPADVQSLGAAEERNAEIARLRREISALRAEHRARPAPSSGP